MNIKIVPLKDIKRYENNVKEHPSKQIESIAQSIKTFGFRQPIVIDANNIIVCGHARYDAAEKIGLAHVPCEIASDLSEEQINAYRILDNEIAKQGSTNVEALHIELAKLPDFDFAPFNIEIPKLEILNEALCDDDEIPEITVNPKTKLGDVWLLGTHRLMCGDSTIIDDVEKLMNGEKADMVFTDPPYGIDYQDVKHKHKKIDNDESLDNIRTLLSLILINDCPLFICCNWKFYSAFEKAMQESGKNPKACIVWDKGSRIQNLDKFGKQHEFILYYGPFGGEKTVDVDVWECKREILSEHPTAKPVELITRAISHFKSKNIVDLFGGSGSTLIACENTNRNCYMMELNTAYCDVIINRWQKFTGKDAILEGNGLKYSEISYG